MIEVGSTEKLKELLLSVPHEWAQALVARTTLRIIPFAFPSNADEIWDEDSALSLLRCAIVGWTAAKHTSWDCREAARQAYEAFQRSPIYGAQSEARYSQIDGFHDAMGTAYAVACNAMVASAPAGMDHGYAVGYGQGFSGAAHLATDLHSIWAALWGDENWLQVQSSPIDAPELLASAPIWLFLNDDAGWRRAWFVARASLKTLHPSYEVWTNWLERRLLGNASGFEIPGDQDSSEDRAILDRLIQATDEDFWNHGAAYVNVTLQGWIDDARARVAPPGEAAEDEATPLPAQARHAVRFQTTADGRIAIDAAALADILRTDAEARDRHAEAAALAREMLAGCQGSNAGARMIPMLEAYLDAAGDNVETMRPSLFVQRGERLRQELAGYARPDTMLAPLADTVLLDGQSWRSAHNMAVGLDPVLMALDTAQRGPDVQPAPLEPGEIRTLARAADAAGALVEGVAAVVIEAADLAPAVPDPADRRTRWSSDTAQNLVIEAFAVALNHPRTTLAGIAATAVVAPQISAAAVVVGVATSALPATQFLVANRHWIETRLGNTPTWQSLFVQLCNRLEAHTPFRPKDRDDGI